MEISIRTIELNESDKLGQLREEAYKTKFGSRVDATALHWNSNDLLFMNLGAFDPTGRLISALRLATIESAEEFKRVLLLDFDSSRLKLPLLILSRGATAPEFQSLHLHSLLRHEAITLAQRAGLNHVVGGIEGDAPRLHQLSQLGYEIRGTQTKWDGFLKSEEFVSLAVLDQSSYAGALASLERKIGGFNFVRNFDLDDLSLRIKLHSHRVPHEAIPYSFENLALWNEVKDFLHSHSPAVRSPAVSGWALQAPAGALNPIHAGWEMGFCPYNGPENRGPTWTPINEEERQKTSIQEFNQPTAALFPEMRKLLVSLEHQGLVIRRARIIRLSPGSNMKWHQDGSSRIYQARLHVPLQTNDGCFFESEFGRSQFAADSQLYFVHINRPHRAINEGQTDRYHFVAHIWDTQRFTRHHQYHWQHFDRETHHENEVDFQAQWASVDPTKKN